MTKYKFLSHFNATKYFGPYVGGRHRGQAAGTMESQGLWNRKDYVLEEENLLIFIIKLEAQHAKLCSPIHPPCPPALVFGRYSVRATVLL